ncbi:MAG: hypothetical protein AABZ31_12095 [Bdellovibrionota bacterium]
MLRKFITTALILCQVSAPVHFAYAQPALTKGTQPPVQNETPPPAPIESDMSLPEARAVIAEADRTQISDVLGADEAAITPAKKQRFRVKWRKLIEANYVVRFIPGKNSFMSWWQKNEDQTLKERRLLKKGTLQTLMVVSVVLAVAAATNAHYNIIPFGMWMDQALVNPDLKAASATSIEKLWAISSLVISKLGDGFMLGVKFVGGIAGAVLTYSILSSLMTAFISRPKNVMEQKLNAVSGVVFGPFTTWLTARLDSLSDRVSRMGLRFTNLSRRLKGQPPIVLDSTDTDEVLNIQNLTRGSLSQIQQLQAHWKSVGLNTNLNSHELDKIISSERVLWSEMQNNYLNNFIETQRTGRTNLWEAVYYSPQHFAQVIRAALSSADNFYENFERAKERIMRDRPEHTGEVKILGQKLKEAIRLVYFNQIRDPELAQQNRNEVQRIKVRLNEIGADPDDIRLLEERMNKHMIAKNEAVMNLVILLRRDIEFGVFTIELPEAAYERLLKVREELGLDYYLQELREEVIALGEDFELNLRAYANFVEMYKVLRSKAEAKKSKSKKPTAPAATAKDCGIHLSAKAS